jgi:hypothetical protein
MSYTILKTDGSALTSVVDGSIDQLSTDLTLIGKNSTGFGVFINDNFVKLLENFSNSSQPNYPLKGQLWFDTTENRLKVYNGAQFVVSGGTIVSTTPPSGIASGDLWIDSLRQQLYFNDGLSTVLAGPLYTADQGITGFTVEDILDSNDIQHTIVYLFVAQTLLGIFSKDTFTPKNPIAGISGTIKVGFTATTLSGMAFNVTTSQAQSLIAADGTLKTPESFVSTTASSQTIGTLSIQNSTPLVLGSNANTEVNVTSSLFKIKSNATNQNFQVQLLGSTGVQYPLHINSSTQSVGIYTDNPTSTLDVNGNARIRGDLTVEGTTTTVNSTVVTIDDKNIELGSVATPTNTTANGGGITLKGTTDKTLTWVNSTSSWTSSEHVDLVSGKTYKINGFDVISNNSLGPGIISAPGLTSIGTLTTLQVSNVNVAGNTISYVNAVNPNGDIILDPKGTGSVDVSNATVINVATPVNGTDATNKTYVDTKVTTIPLAITLTIGARSNTQLAADFLSKIFPNTEHLNTSICRVFVTDDSSIRQFALQSGTWTWQANL